MAIINKLLAYQPERRYPSAAAIREDLEAFLSDRVPAAVAEFQAPPTTTIDRPPLPLPAQSPADLVPPTDPLPLTGLPPVLPTIPLPAAAPPPLPTPRARVRRWPAVRRVAWLAMLLTFVAMLAMEGAAWVAAERFRQTVDAIDGRTLNDRKQDYDRINSWGTLDLGLCWRVNGPLRERLVGIAETIIADYRSEQPSVGTMEWRQAGDALRWAQQLAPGDRSLQAKQVDCDAHVTRIAAQIQPRGTAQRRQLFQSAIAKFQRAAELDPTSFDRYLGISRTEVYGFDDVDAAVAAIAQAEKRGYHPSRRERAQLGDGYMRSAEKSRRLARTLSGDQRQRELENAQAAYAHCVEMFDPIVGFGNAAQNLEYCKRRQAAVSQAPIRAAGG